MTVHRKGPNFGVFLGRLLQRMAAGESMPMAWIDVAPQTTLAPQHLDLPDTIFSAGAGPLRLK